MNKKFGIMLILSISVCAVTVIGQTIDKNLWQPYLITSRTGNQHIDLAGTWELSYTDKPITELKNLDNRKDPFQTKVPNSIHWSLYKADKLPHPYVNKNSSLYKWVDEKVWYYKKEIIIPATAKGDFIFLCFDGIDYFSKIWVNDSLLGTHEGMFGGPSVEISRFVNYGKGNTITVEVRAGNWGNKGVDYETAPRTASGARDFTKSPGYNPRASGRIIKPWIISGGSGTEMFFTVGMWQGARIEIVPAFHLERPFLTTKDIAANKAIVHLSCEVFEKAHSLRQQLHPWNNIQLLHFQYGKDYGTKVPQIYPIKEKLSVIFELLNKNGKVEATKEIPLKINEGRNWIEEDIAVPNPELWNPVGMGDPNLYQARITLKKENVAIDKLEFTYGIRKIEHVPTAGPRTADRWQNWQFVVNGRKIFVKGMNWMPADVLLDLPEEQYRWALQAAKDMGVQLIRVWGGGLIETNTFYKICNELGLMVWQDFPIGNQDTPEYPQDVWEAQVVQNIFRLRNHPSLVMWCGGNEFNPYSYGNAASIGILERSLQTFDNTRMFVRTTPDAGSIHTYLDMDPAWYKPNFKYVPWISETGMHTMPEPNLFYEMVDRKDFFDLGKMWDTAFAGRHPDFIHHFAEYGPGRVPRMLSRASHIINIADPTIEDISEASQIGAGEFYQVLSEKVQGNYPVTAGLMPWVFKRPWPVIAIQMMDWFGQPVAPYYFLKRTYDPTHVAIDIPRLLWKANESIDLNVKVTHSLPQAIAAKVYVTVFDDAFKQVWKQEKQVHVAPGTSVTNASLGAYTIPSNYKDRFLFITAELKDAGGKMISRSIYFPRVLTKMEDKSFFDSATLQSNLWPYFNNGPWLKPTVRKTSTTITVKILSNKKLTETKNEIKLSLLNVGTIPAFMTQIDVTGVKRIFTASDNFFWLAPSEKKEVTLKVQWREKPFNPVVTAAAWNTQIIQNKLMK